MIIICHDVNEVELLSYEWQVIAYGYGFGIRRNSGGEEKATTMQHFGHFFNKLVKVFLVVFRIGSLSGSRVFLRNT